MNNLVIALAPVFAAGLAVQQFLEILTSVLDLGQRAAFEKHKKAILGLASLTLGLVFASSSSLRVLKPLFTGVVTDPVTIPTYLDYIVTALVISAGTEGVNSILKFLKYKKEETKGDAAAKVSATTSAVAAEPVLVPTPVALTAINRK